jgi:Zn-dependent peptidase ImmA (M78 family)
MTVVKGTLSAPHKCQPQPISKRFHTAPKRVRTEICIAKAQQALAAFAGGHAMLAAPIPIELLATELGYQVIPLNTVDGELSGLVSVQQKLIGVNSRHHRHRQRFTVAHELAHILMSHPPESRSSASDTKLFNVEADECAAELLMPQNLLLPLLAKTRATSVLARIFDVSEEAITLKLLRISAAQIQAER